MKYFRRFLKSLPLCAAANCPAICAIFGLGVPLTAVICIASAVFTAALCVSPTMKKYPSVQSRALSGGTELLVIFLFALTIELTAAGATIYALVKGMLSPLMFSLNCAAAVLALTLVFWSGIIRVYCASVQLGLKWRVIGIVCAWLPIINIAVLLKICRLTDREALVEAGRRELDELRSDNGICRTKYPILLVHGVFFRDSKLLNYWGRIPDALTKNGATIYYGNQPSADSVPNCGEMLAKRIEQIVFETGCEKVNIIAHSKGGLDSRYAVSCCGADKYTASLTTVCTPHRGCIFAENLLNMMPKSAADKIAEIYNSTYNAISDEKPDFLAAINDLTNKKASELSDSMPDMDGVYYQSVGAKAKNAMSGRFPLNLSFPIVKYFDGDNDGLVAVESAKWGEDFTLVEVKGKRGVTHADMIDLNRENIKGFDVREFYVKLVSGLKERGL